MTEKASAAERLVDLRHEHENLTDALVAFQTELPDVSKGGTNPAFHSKYATLPDITKAVFPLLTKHGLAFTAYPDETEHGSILRFELRHVSGDKIAGAFGLPEGAKAQEYGSWFTYFRRYVLSSITGITPDDDDDGNTAATARTRRPTAAESQAKVAVQKLSAASSLDELRTTWETTPPQVRAEPSVLAAKDARKAVLETPLTERWEAKPVPE